LITGKFHKVEKKFNPNVDKTLSKKIDADGDGIESTQEKIDYEMKQQQKLWVNRINKIYNLTLGLLGGMALMHLILVLANPDINTFLASYGPFANLICQIF